MPKLFVRVIYGALSGSHRRGVHDGDSDGRAATRGHREDGAAGGGGMAGASRRTGTGRPSGPPPPDGSGRCTSAMAQLSAPATRWRRAAGHGTSSRPGSPTASPPGSGLVAVAAAAAGEASAVAQAAVRNRRRPAGPPGVRRRDRARLRGARCATRSRPVLRLEPTRHARWLIAICVRSTPYFA